MPKILSTAPCLEYAGIDITSMGRKEGGEGTFYFGYSYQVGRSASNQALSVGEGFEGSQGC
jgi:hypothetical protein